MLRRRLQIGRIVRPRGTAAWFWRSEARGWRDPTTVAAAQRAFAASPNTDEAGVVRVNVWASPRCASTSLMYAFAQRSDTAVFDEPLYAHYLANINPSAFRPYRAEVLRAQDNDGNAVVRDLILAPPSPGGARVRFFKHMAKHLQLLDHGFLASTRNVILCRHPAEILASWSATLGDAHTSVRDIGLDQQMALLELLRSVGQEPIVVVNDTLVRRPEGTLRALCAALGIKYEPGMTRCAQGSVCCCMYLSMLCAALGIE